MYDTSITTLYNTSINNIIYQTVLGHSESPFPVFSKGENFNTKEIFYGIRLALSHLTVVLTDFILGVLDHLTNIFPLLGKPNTIINIHQENDLVRYKQTGIIFTWLKILVLSVQPGKIYF